MSKPGYEPSFRDLDNPPLRTSLLDGKKRPVVKDQSKDVEEECKSKDHSNQG